MSDDFYKFVADEKEIKWYYDHLLRDLKPGESWMLCLGARDKKLTEEEKPIYQLGRSEMMDEHIIRYHHEGSAYKYFVENIYKFETRKAGLTTKTGIPYPEKCMVVYFTVNPCSSIGCVRDTVDYSNLLTRQMTDSYIKHSGKGVEDHLFKFSKVFDHLKSVHARNPSEKILVDFDVDCDLTNVNEDEFFHQLSDMTSARYPRGTYAFIRTSGGFHINVKFEALKIKMKGENGNNPNNYVKEIEAFLEERKIPNSEVKYNVNVTEDELGRKRNTSAMIPMPGTYQYQKPVYVVNKYDFE